MLFLLISVLPFFILLSKRPPLQPLPAWASEVRLLSALFWQELLYFAVHYLENFREVGSRVLRMPVKMASKRKCGGRVENAEESREMSSILDLPDLALECILGKLAPSGLCNMAGVCTSLRDMCRDDYLWERHMREKWGKVIGQAAKMEFDSYLASREESSPGGFVERHSAGEHETSEKKWIMSLSWPFSWLKSRLDSGSMISTPLPDNSIMSWYLSLESGKFWFPAQVYNREHGHVGFMLSCYDAELSYDCRTDTFQARYPPHGIRPIVVEDGVQWDRIRAPAVDTPAHDLHISDCLHDLRPGDHIEIQWRKNKKFPYGWWYGIVGHMEPCDGSPHFCRCHQFDSVVLEFNQYTPGSRWRQTTISRKHHREGGNETDGFYGGIRKLYKKDEISTWKQLWPVEVLE